MRFSKKQLIAGGAAAVIVASGAGVAFAYWTSTGTGSGSATTGSSTAFAVTVDSVDLANLTPGGPTDTIAFHVNNPSTGHQNFASAVATVTGTNKAGCDASDFAITGTTAAYGDLAGGATANGSFVLQMIDKTTSQDACQGATVSLQVVAS